MLFIVAEVLGRLVLLMLPLCAQQELLPIQQHTYRVEEDFGIDQDREL